jgi:hypothetical protein
MVYHKSQQNKQDDLLDAAGMSTSAKTLPRINQSGNKHGSKHFDSTKIPLLSQYLICIECGHEALTQHNDENPTVLMPSRTEKEKSYILFLKPVLTALTMQLILMMLRIQMTMNDLLKCSRNLCSVWIRLNNIGATTYVNVVQYMYIYPC